MSNQTQEKIMGDEPSRAKRTEFIVKTEFLDHGNGRASGHIMLVKRPREKAREMTPVEMWRVAEILAEQVGGVVVSEPPHPDCPHSRKPDRLSQVIGQYRTDLALAHAEICRLQGLDPTKNTWPAWSPQANTLRWLDGLERDGASQ